MTIQEKVAEKINAQGTTKVIDIVVDKLVEIEVNKRVDIINKALTKQDSLEKEFSKINGKCDNISYGKDGSKIEVMTEKRFNDIKKAKEQLDNFTKSLEACLSSNTAESYTKLNGMLGGNKEQGTTEVKPEA